MITVWEAKTGVKANATYSLCLSSGVMMEIISILVNRFVVMEVPPVVFNYSRLAT